jgi:hypothetical protein
MKLPEVSGPCKIKRGHSSDKNSYLLSRNDNIARDHTYNNKQ